MSRFLLAVLVLTVIYALVLGSFDPWNELFGACLSGALLLVYRDFLFGGWPRSIPGLARRAIAFLPFAWMVAIDIVRGTWNVALITLHLRPLEHPGIVAVPIEDRTPTGIAVTTLVTTLSPGTYLVDVDPDRGLMLFHVIGARDTDAIRAQQRDFYHRYQRHGFP